MLLPLLLAKIVATSSSLGSGGSGGVLTPTLLIGAAAVLVWLVLDRVIVEGPDGIGTGYVNNLGDLENTYTNQQIEQLARVARLEPQQVERAAILAGEFEVDDLAARQTVGIEPQFAVAGGLRERVGQLDHAAGKRLGGKRSVVSRIAKLGTANPRAIVLMERELSSQPA